MCQTGKSSMLPFYVPIVFYVILIVMGYIVPWSFVITFPLMIGSIWYQYSAMSRDYARLVRRVEFRPAISVGEEWLAKNDAEVGVEDAVRIWTGLASFYELPPDRLRHDDRIDVELAHMFKDVDCGLCDIITEHGGCLEMLGDYCRVWGGWVVAIHRLEKELGREVDLVAGPSVCGEAA